MTRKPDPVYWFTLAYILIVFGGFLWIQSHMSHSHLLLTDADIQRRIAAIDADRGRTTSIVAAQFGLIACVALCQVLLSMRALSRQRIGQASK